MLSMCKLGTAVIDLLAATNIILIVIVHSCHFALLSQVRKLQVLKNYVQACYEVKGSLATMAKIVTNYKSQISY